MPVTTSAKIALRKDRRRTITNNQVRSQMRSTIKKIKTTKNHDMLPEAYSIIDKAAKKNIIHSNKAARIKSQLSKVGIISKTKAAVKKTKKTTTPTKKSAKTQ